MRAGTESQESLKKEERSLLETIRQYAAERLAAIGGVDELRRSHALACLAMAREAVVDPMNDITARLESLDPEHCNVRTAMSWAIEHEPDAIALTLAEPRQ